MSLNFCLRLQYQHTVLKVFKCVYVKPMSYHKYERKSMNLLRMLVHLCRFEVHTLKCRCILGVNGFIFIELHVLASYRYRLWYLNYIIEIFHQFDMERLLFWLQIQIPDRSISFDPRVTENVTLEYKSYVVIPHNSTWTAVPESLATRPVYWSLPESFLGDWV